jgi:hypothetical protein
MAVMHGKYSLRFESDGTQSDLNLTVKTLEQYFFANEATSEKWNQLKAFVAKLEEYLADSCFRFNAHAF